MANIKERINILIYNMKNVKTFKKNVHIGDLLCPYDGKITAMQYLVITRLIDIENFYLGEKKFLYQTRFSKHDNRPEEFISKGNELFEKLLINIDKYGFVYRENDEPIHITVDPLIYNHGSHRLGAMIYHRNKISIMNNIYVYVNFSFRRSWLPLDGEKWLSEYGFSTLEIENITNKYNTILNEFRTDISGVCLSTYKDVVLSYIDEIGTISRLVYFDDNRQILFFIKLKKQKMYLDNSCFKSVYVEQVSTKISNVLKEWGWICNSVTQSIESELALKEKYNL